MLLICASLLLKHDCMSVILPSVEDLPVISKCISISESTSLASNGKSELLNPEDDRGLGIVLSKSVRIGASILPWEASCSGLGKVV